MRPQILQHSGWQATMLQNHWRILFIFQQVVGTSSSVFRCHKYSFFNKICNITKCSSLWSLGHLRPLWCSQFAFKSIPQAIYNLDLPFIHWNLSMSLPEIRLLDNSIDSCLCMKYRSLHCLQKPLINPCILPSRWRTSDNMFIKRELFHVNSAQVGCCHIYIGLITIIFLHKNSSMKRKNKLFASYFEENKTSILIIAWHLSGGNSIGKLEFSKLSFIGRYGLVRKFAKFVRLSKV